MWFTLPMQNLGKKVKFQTSHSDGSLITFGAVIVKVTATKKGGEAFLVEIPARVRALKFAPFDGKRFVLVDAAKVAQSIY